MLLFTISLQHELLQNSGVLVTTSGGPHGVQEPKEFSLYGTGDNACEWWWPCLGKTMLLGAAPLSLTLLRLRYGKLLITELYYRSTETTNSTFQNGTVSVSLLSSAQQSRFGLSDV